MMQFAFVFRMLETENELKPKKFKPQPPTMRAVCSHARRTRHAICRERQRITHETMHASMEWIWSEDAADELRSYDVAPCTRGGGSAAGSARFGRFIDARQCAIRRSHRFGAAARRFHVNHEVLIAIVWKDSHLLPGYRHVNFDGSTHFGLMQINSRNFASLLASGRPGSSSKRRGPDIPFDLS